jgi:predicted dehydrogenase
LQENFYPSTEAGQLQNALQQGKLGELIAVNGIWFVRKHDSYFDATWRREHGGGPFLINLIHDIDCFRFMCGEIESVQAISSNRVRGFPVEDTAAILIKFRNGALGTMIMSDAVPSPWAWDMASAQAPYFPYTHADCYYIGGSRASLSVPTMELWWHKDGGDWRDPVTHERIPTEHSNCFINQLKHLVDIVRNGAKAICDARDGMMSLAATLAVRTAAQEQRSVSISELLA